MKKLFTLITCCLLSACGTLFSGTNQTLTVNSNVDHAKVYVNGMPICSTPCAIDLNRSNTNATLIFKKDGYEDMVFILKSQFNQIALANLTMVYSWTTDFISGGVWQYAPDSVYVEMEKSKMTKAELDSFKKDSDIRRFVLFNFKDLKSGKDEHLNSLAELTGLNKNKISNIMMACNTEIDAIKNITSVIN